MGKINTQGTAEQIIFSDLNVHLAVGVKLPDGHIIYREAGDDDFAFFHMTTEEELKKASKRVVELIHECAAKGDELMSERDKTKMALSREAQLQKKLDETIAQKIALGQELRNAWDALFPEDGHESAPPSAIDTPLSEMVSRLMANLKFVKGCNAKQGEKIRELRERVEAAETASSATGAIVAHHGRQTGRAIEILHRIRTPAAADKDEIGKQWIDVALDYLEKPHGTMVEDEKLVKETLRSMGLPTDGLGGKVSWAMRLCEHARKLHADVKHWRLRADDISEDRRRSIDGRDKEIGQLKAEIKKCWQTNNAMDQIMAEVQAVGTEHAVSKVKELAAYARVRPHEGSMKVGICTKGIECGETPPTPKVDVPDVNKSQLEALGAISHPHLGLSEVWINVGPRGMRGGASVHLTLQDASFESSRGGVSATLRFIYEDAIRRMIDRCAKAAQAAAWPLIKDQPKAKEVAVVIYNAIREVKL